MSSERLHKSYRMATYRDISVQDSSYALEFVIVSLYTIDTVSSNLKRRFNEKNITTIITLTKTRFNNRVEEKYW